MSDAGVYALLGALVVGILTGEHTGPGPAIALLGATVAVGASAAIARGRARLALVLLAVALVGGALMQRALDGLVHSPLAEPIELRADATITASLVDDPSGSRFSARVLVRAERVTVDGGTERDAGHRTLLVVADGEAAPRLRLLGAGDHVVLRGWLRPLDGYDRWLRWRHVVGRFDATALRGFAGSRSPLTGVANQLRGLVLRGSAPLPSTERALVAGFLLGDTRDLPFEVLTDFRSAGLSHLLAVSGANVAFVLALLSPLLRRLSRHTRLGVGVASVVVFGAMTRWEPSVLRACAMAGCTMLALHAGRPTAARRVLPLAAGALLLVDPFLVHSIGFLLSCGACLGIVLLGPRLVGALPGPRWLGEVLGTTAAAQIGVAPVLLPVFGSLPLVALPANLLAVPLAAPLTCWGLLAGFVGGLLPRGGAGAAPVLHLPTRLLADAMLGIADLASRAPLAVDERNALGIVAVAALIAALVLRRMLRRHAPADDAVVVPPR